MSSNFGILTSVVAAMYKGLFMVENLISAVFLSATNCFHSLKSLKFTKTIRVTTAPMIIAKKIPAVEASNVLQWMELHLQFFDQLFSSSSALVSRKTMNA